MSKLNIRLLGNPDILLGDNSINSKLSAKSIGIIAILICSEHNKLTREKIAYMLWPECYETASYNLRYNLWNINKNIPKDENGQEFLIADRKYCYINTNYLLDSDVKFLDNVNLEDEKNNLEFLENVNKQFRGDFIEDYYVKDSDNFNDWVFSQRTKYQKMHLQTLNFLLDIYLKDNNYLPAKNILEKILEMNPYDDESHYKLMDVLVKNNESNLAIFHYKEYETLLREDLNVFPQQKIKDLYSSLIDKKQDKDTKENGKNRKSIVIRVNEYSDEKIDYFVMSDLIDKLLLSLKPNVIQNIPQIYLEDVSVIQPGIFQFISNVSAMAQVNEIRLFHSLKNILQHLSNDYSIQIIVYNKNGIDQKSKQFLNFIEAKTNICINYLDE